MELETITTPNYGAPVESRLEDKPKRSNIRYVLIFIVIVITMVYFYIIHLMQPSPLFPINTPIEVTPGMGVKQITLKLAESNVVRSPWLLYATIAFYYNPKDVKASTYIFTTPKTTGEIAEALTKGDFTSSLISFTHIEGESVEDIARRATVLLPDFDEAEFIQNGLPHEGTLFPDTYLIPKNYTASELQANMLATYEEKVAPLRNDIKAVNLSEDQVIILASIIEREANSPESMAYVAGILQNRLKKGMYLQVDASIEYILHKTLAELVPEDLKIDSPYNTYTNPGLPPTPIGNPGLDAIKAVLKPTPSDYLFYITGDDGTFHYARTFEEHKLNVARYLR